MLKIAPITPLVILIEILTHGAAKSALPQPFHQVTKSARFLLLLPLYD